MFRYLVRTLAISAIVLALAGCAAGGDGEGDPSGGTGGTGSGSSGGGGGAGGDAGGCESTSDCGGGAVCDPATRTCTEEPLACEAHDDCSAGAFCNDAGACERNATGGPCAEDQNCPKGESCTGGFCGCEGEEFVAELVPPNVLVMLDKSGSMDDPVGGTPKWDVAVTALESLLAEYGDEIRFGLVLYPAGGDKCGAGTVRVDIGEGTATDILAELDASGPNGSTPIGASLEAAYDYEGLEDPDRANYVLLLTDGDERCSGNGEAAVEALRTKDPEVKTFVVGFGGGVDATELNAMAVAGGTALAGDTKYYQADDAASLEAAFAGIGGEVLSCSYQLSATESPLTAKDIFVYFDGESVEHDASGSEGWTYDAESNRITFHGADCEALRGGAVEDLVIVHGCPINLG